jgi:hypothetical protein
MKTLAITTLGIALLIPAGAQTLDINLDALSAKAKEKAEITLEGAMLGKALEAVPDKVRGSVGNISRLRVRHYVFAQAGQYSDADIDPIRKQVSGASGWTRIISTKEDHESVDIYMLNQNGKAAGFLLIAAEAKELTVVQIAGSIDLSNLAGLKEVVDSTIKYDLKSAAGQ